VACKNPRNGGRVNRSYLVFVRMAEKSGYSINLRHKEIVYLALNFLAVLPSLV